MARTGRPRKEVCMDNLVKFRMDDEDYRILVELQGDDKRSKSETIRDCIRKEYGRLTENKFEQMRTDNKQIGRKEIMSSSSCFKKVSECMKCEFYSVCKTHPDMIDEYPNGRCRTKEVLRRKLTKDF